jgi:hypothetical protein
MGETARNAGVVCARIAADIGKTCAEIGDCETVGYNTKKYYLNFISSK